MKDELYQSPAKIFDHLFQVLINKRFLNMEGLGKEVPFFIFPYPPEMELEIQKIEKQLLNQLKQNGIAVINLNLYDICIELLQKRGIWARILQDEKTYSKDSLLELLQGVLDAETHLIPSISELLSQQPYDILFLTGVGEVYPYIRSHNVLNNLQKAVKNRPALMFFPGNYSHSLEKGSSLDLFGRREDDRYYRAFDIRDYQI